MRVKVNFRSSSTRFKVSFRDINNVSDGGYERGYEAGYKDGYENGIPKNGLVITDADETGNIIAADWYGSVVANFKYAWYGNTQYPTLTAKTDVIELSPYAFINAFVTFADGFFNATLYAGDYALAIQRTKNANIYMPVFTGYTSSERTNAPSSLFRTPSKEDIQKFILEKVEIVGDFWWYQKNFKDGIIQLGSVGHPLLSVRRRPFGGTSGSAVITVYTNGELLDNIQNAIMPEAGTGLTFVYKSAVNTVYKGVSYIADEIILKTTT